MRAHNGDVDLPRSAEQKHSVPESHGPLIDRPQKGRGLRPDGTRSATACDGSASHKESCPILSGSIEVPAEHVSILPTGDELPLYALMATFFSSGASVLLSLHFSLSARPLSCLVAGLVVGAAGLAYLVAFYLDGVFVGTMGTVVLQSSGFTSALLCLQTAP